MYSTFQPFTHALYRTFFSYYQLQQIESALRYFRSRTETGVCFRSDGPCIMDTSYKKDRPFGHACFMKSRTQKSTYVFPYHANTGQACPLQLIFEKISDLAQTGRLATDDVRTSTSQRAKRDTSTNNVDL